MEGPNVSWWRAVTVLHQLASDKYEDRTSWHENDVDLDAAWRNGGCSIQAVPGWPVDATMIHADPKLILVLGSLKSAIAIPDSNARIGHSIDIVISMNNDDRWYQGEATNYAEYYASVNVQFNLRYGGYDKQDIWGHEADAKRSEYILRWWQVATDLRQSLQWMQRRDPVVVLIHCFGGVNRSSSTLCALSLCTDTQLTKRSRFW